MPIEDGLSTIDIDEFEKNLLGGFSLAFLFENLRLGSLNKDQALLSAIKSAHEADDAISILLAEVRRLRAMKQKDCSSFPPPKRFLEER